MRRPILLLMGVSLALAGVVWFWTVHNSVTFVRVGGTGRWNQGPLTVAERTYFTAGIDRILFAWRDLNAAAGLGSDAAKRSTEPNDPAILAIDVEGKAMWIERRGLRLQPYRALLPEDLAWRMYRDGVPGQESFHGVLRLAMEGGSGSASYDRFDLIGEGSGWYLQAEPSHPLDGTRLVETAFKPEDLQTDEHRRKTQVVMRSIAEPGGQANSTPEPPLHGRDDGGALQTQDANSAWVDWPTVERTVYAQLGQRVASAGMLLTDINVSVAEDGETACATISAVEQMSRLRGWIMQKLLRRASAPANLVTVNRQRVAIDRVMPGIWYVRDVPSSAGHKAASVKVEFLLVTDRGVLSATNRREALRIGRSRYAAINPDMAAHHRVTLASGVRVEVLGVCECPTARKAWWGPDGRPLKEAPWIRWGMGEGEVSMQMGMAQGWRVTFGTLLGRAGRQTKEYAVVVRVSDPKKEAVVGRVQWERSGYDHGDAMRSMGTICVLVPSYDTEAPCATAVIGVTRTPYSSNPEEGMEWVRLEKVSFSPGSDHGFRLVYPAEPPATRGRDHDT